MIKTILSHFGSLLKKKCLQESLHSTPDLGIPLSSLTEIILSADLILGPSSPSRSGARYPVDHKLQGSIQAL